MTMPGGQVIYTARSRLNKKLLFHIVTVISDVSCGEFSMHPVRTMTTIWQHPENILTLRRIPLNTGVFEKHLRGRLAKVFIRSVDIKSNHYAQNLS